MLSENLSFIPCWLTSWLLLFIVIILDVLHQLFLLMAVEIDLG